jgi:flagellar hook-basal body complex protein FliE
MSSYRSAMGKTVDMASLMAKNETTRAVGNMSVNARGDTIVAFGRVVQNVTEKVNQAYANTVGTRSANQVRQQRPQQQVKTEIAKADIQLEELVPVELTKEELDLDRDLEDDEIAEQLKAMEAKLPKAKK